jgi:NOL1/NOP2/fmu family ribosome biogenesis protein
VWELAENIERWGAANAIILNETPTRLLDDFEGFFDRVLLDAPCSGEGMFRKSENARRDWSPQLVAACALRQSAILEDATRLVRPGGVLVYSTCTFSTRENESVIVQLLKNHPDFELEHIEPRAGFSPALVDNSVEVQGSARAGMVRLWPHRVEGEGHFIARMRRTIQKNAGSKSQFPLSRIGISDRPASQGQRRAKPHTPPKDAISVYLGFCDQVGLTAMPEERLALVGSYLYKTVEGAPPLDGLTVIHSGLWLGTHKTGSTNRSRFIPAHALALWLNPDQVSNTINLDHQQAIRYLQGYSLDLPGRDGWTLVCVDRFSLGWGRRVNGIVKNYYPKGLRWRSV